MDYPIETPGFEGRGLAIRASGIFSGVSLMLDGDAVEGKWSRYEVRDNEGSPRIIRLIRQGADPIPKVEIDGNTLTLARQFAWYEQVWFALPMGVGIGMASSTGFGLVGGLLSGAGGILAGQLTARILRVSSSLGQRLALSGLVWLGAAASVAVASMVLQAAIGGKIDVSSRESLERAAEHANKSLPMVVDDETEVLRVEGLEGVLVYYSKLLNVPPGQLSAAKLVDRFQTRVAASVCSVEASREDVLNKGVIMRYVYSDSEDGKIGQFDVLAADCE